MLWSAAYAQHKAHSAGWETADHPDQSGLQVALAALLLQVQVDPLWGLRDPAALEQSPDPVAVEPGP